MKRQWDALMDQAARVAAGFEQDGSMIRPEFVLAATFYVRYGLCQKMFECITTEEEGFQALYLECLAHHYAVSLSDALNSMERGRVPKVPLSPTMKKIVRNAKSYWREKHETEPPVDYLLHEILTCDDGLPVMELCLDEAMMGRETAYMYLAGCSRYFGNTFGASGTVGKTYASLADFASDNERKSSRRKAESKAKISKGRDINAIERQLRGGIIGQEAAIAAVVRALKKDAAGLKEEYKPVGVFIFAGPTGVGKTELARVLERATGMKMKRLDMSEYSEKHEAARLYGAPPGYVGYDEGGELTNFVSQHSKSIVVFDEVDKAHPDVMNTLLQIAEEGTLTDGRGRVVSFAETIIIITTNAGSKDATKHMMGFGAESGAGNYRAAAYKRAIEEFFRPELRGRMTDIVVFDDLEAREILTIAKLELAKLSAKILKSREIRLVVADGVAEMVVGQSDTALYGARNLKATIDRLIAEPLANFILEHNAAAGTVVRVLLDGCGISLGVENVDTP